jgi:uncharacterized cofD-like protein
MARIPAPSDRLRIVVVGGGTGSYTVLSGLKEYPVDLTAIVAMSDDGGSTGRLRDEYGVLPPGDLRQALVALSEASVPLRKLFTFRYGHGDFEGHSFGNIFISTLEQLTGSLDRALALAGDILKIRGAVVPVTLDPVHLVAKLRNGKVLAGERALDDYQLITKFGIERIYLTPVGRANPKALAAIKEADLIVVGPGSFYTSIVPNFLVQGIARAVRASKAKKLFICNLMNKHGQTDGFTVARYVQALEEIAKGTLFDAVLYNTKLPQKRLLRRYADEGEPVLHVAGPVRRGLAVIGEDLIAQALYKQKAGDAIARTLIRHDPRKLARAILSVINEH